MPEEHEIQTRLRDIEETLETVCGVVLGRPGHPEESLIVQVREIRDDLGLIKKVVYFIAASAGAAVVKTLWDLITSQPG